MNVIEIINIFIIIIISIFVFISNYIFILNSNKNISLFYRKPWILLIVSLNNLIICVIHLLKASFGKKIHHLIYFDIYNVTLFVFISMYTYRGIYLYLFNNNKKNENTRISIYTFFFIIKITLIFYICSINKGFSNIYFNTYDWQYFPLFFIYLFCVLILNPIISIFLRKTNYKNISNEIICITFLLILGHIMEIIFFIYPDNYIFEIVKNYIQSVTFFLSYLIYIFIPLIQFLLKEKKIYKNKIKIKDLKINNNIEMRIKKEEEKAYIEDILIKLYEIFYNEL